MTEKIEARYRIVPRLTVIILKTLSKICVLLVLSAN